MSSRVRFIVDVAGVKKPIKINKDETNMQQLKEKIITKFKNITFDREFNVMTILFNEECEIDDDDIEDLENGAKLFIKFKSNENILTSPDGGLKNEIEKQFVAKTDNNDDNKEIEDESDDGQQEVQVNQHDLREKAFGCSIQDKDIISCIGKIRSTFITSDNSTKTSVGTGTVYKFVDSYAYIITCAHNLRYTEYYECNDCKQKNKRRICSNCSKKNTTAHILNAGKVYFQRRKLENGLLEREYKCDADIIYIQDDKYAEYPLPKSGYDIAILRFIDEDNYYLPICKNMLLVDAKLFHRIKGQLSYYIYGYPAIVGNIKRKEMWGAESINDIFKYEENEYDNGQSFLKQTEIDASKGTSGAAIFSIFNQYTLIFAIHTGGSIKNHYNVGTLLTETIDYLKIQTIQNETIKTKQELINETLKKITMKNKFYSPIQNRFIYRRAQHSDAFNPLNNIGIVWTQFKEFKKHLIKYQSNGFIIGHAPKYAYVLTVACAVTRNNIKPQKISFELLRNSHDALDLCYCVRKYVGSVWKTDGNIAVIKINDRNNLLAKVK
eukprot:451723_1